MSPLTPEQSTLAADNQGLVWRVALKLQNHGVELDDLVGWGQFGLLHACRRYDPKQGVRFSTYATWCIRGRILRALAEQSRTIRVPAGQQTKANRGKWGAYQALAEADLGTPLCELAIQREGPDPLEASEDDERITDLLGYLKPRAAQILRLRFGLIGEQQTLEQVGARFGIHKERVRQVQNEALKHLRERVGAAS